MIQPRRSYSSLGLLRQGTSAGIGEEFLKRIDRADYDLLVLDWELPDTTGVEILRIIRSTVNWHVPVLFVTQRDAEDDIVEALSSGADDYMVKRASKAEFLARISALSRRLGSAELEAEFGQYLFNLENKTVSPRRLASHGGKYPYGRCARVAGTKTACHLPGKWFPN